MRLYQASELILGLLIIPLVGLLVQELLSCCFQQCSWQRGTVGQMGHPSTFQ